MIAFIVTVLLSFLSGIITVLFAVLFFLYKYKDDLFQTKEKPKIEYEKPHLSDLLHYNLHNANGGSTLGEKETCLFINVLFSFIFREWRDTNQLQKWVLKKINIEFMEFMETKTASRLLHGLKIHDVSLGSNFPVFHNVKIKEPFSFTGDELPETVILELDMEYHGGFFLAIDVDLVFGKAAFLAVRITYVRGKIRLHFGRQPCTHWSLTFVEDPEIKFDVETSFETTQLPQLKSLIVNQIRRTIKRKHTLPHYKMRYNPFFSFQHPEQSPFDGFIADIPIQPSTLEVCVAAATRLLVSSKGDKERNSDSSGHVVFATLSVNSISCIGKSLLRSRTIQSGNPKTESIDVPNSSFSLFDTPSTSRTNQPITSKTSTTPFDTIQRVFRKDSDRTKKKLNMASSQANAIENVEKEPTIPKIERRDSRCPTYMMVALNFGATLREEIRDDGQKVVIVENITEHNFSGQSGMKDGDTVVELNGVEITSLSQAIATIERIRAVRESFKFKVKRDRSNPDLKNLEQTNGENQDGEKSSGSMDTESDHSDVDFEDYQDFVNISLQVAELHMKEKPINKRSHSMSDEAHGSSSVPNAGPARPHSASIGSGEANAEVPYMTLVSSPTPSGSTTSLKDAATAEKPPQAQSSTTKQKTTERELLGKKKLNVNKVSSPRSKSESPPIFRKTIGPAQPSTPKSNKVRKDLSAKKDSSPKKTVSTSRQHENPNPVPTKETENLRFARVDDDHDSQLFKTSLVNSNQREYSWNTEKFDFNLKEHHRYLNIRYWSRQIGKHGIIKTKQPQIIGCVAIPLCELEMVCRGITSRRVTRRFPLFAPNELPQDHKWFLNDPVSNRSSFREKYCYGDTTLTVKVIPKVGNKNNSNRNDPSESDTAGTFFPDDATNGMVNTEMLNKMSRKNGSDYLLSAATPSGRKLLVSRETQTQDKNPPSPQKSAQNTNAADEDQIPIADNDISDESTKVVEKQSISQIIRGFIQGNKNESEQRKSKNVEQNDTAEVADNGKDKDKSEDIAVGVITYHKSTIAHHFETVRFTKSMKCSHCSNKLWAKTGLQCVQCSAVCHKRCIEKFKKETNCVGDEIVTISESNKNEHFVVVDTDTEDSESAPDLNSLPTMAFSLRNKILDMTSTPSIKDENENAVRNKETAGFSNSKHPEDILAVNAKEMGKDLHRDLPISERKTMLENQTQKVENELHFEIEEKEKLMAEQKQYNCDSFEWKRLERKVSKSDERLQALALLLLHYRAGLEDCEYEATDGGLVLSDDDGAEFTASDSESVPVIHEEK